MLSAAKLQQDLLDQSFASKLRYVELGRELDGQPTGEVYVFSMSAKDTLEPFTTGSFPAVQFNPSQKPFVAFGIEPIADDDFLEMPARYPTLNAPFDVLER